LPPRPAGTAGRSWAPIAGIAAALLLQPGAAVADNMPDLKDPSRIAAGHALYRAKHCTHCHGAAGDGGVNLIKRDLGSPAHVFDAIASGRERGSIRMPAFRDVLSDEEIWQATAYVMSLARKPD
jgi:mono/diheme cytochrome c family protein